MTAKSIETRAGEVLKFFSGAQLMAFAPALALGAFWIGGEPALIITALGFPLILLAAWALAPLSAKAESGWRKVAVMSSEKDLISRLDDAFSLNGTSLNKQAACFVVHILDLNIIKSQHGSAAVLRIQEQVKSRLALVLRGTDACATLNSAQFGIALSPDKRLDLENAVDLANRLVATAHEPIQIDGVPVYPSAAVGFCVSGQEGLASGIDMLDGARDAVKRAQTNGPGSVRAYTPLAKRSGNQIGIAVDEALEGLETGQFAPWFQPQISNDTGRVVGFEVLARWNHPIRGVLGPSHFLPLFEEARALSKLGRVMLIHALTALQNWDDAGFDVPIIGINFSSEELDDPNLLRHINNELARFSLTADRLSIEILENVVASSPDDMVTRNLRALGNLGCTIDLDDFGTGSASISAIMRFNVQRIKIDRSFVTKLDRDPNQQRMITAIITMAQQLNLVTLAEGVETVGEHTILAQLGCDEVQGFAIARPMPFDQTLDWMRAHEARLSSLPKIEKKQPSDRQTKG